MSRRALVLVGITGILIGLGAYTFYYARGFSYFSHDPRACVNCHIMQPQFDAWQKASHHTSAACVDCHLPHSLIPKLIAKSDNGYRHSKGFTLQDFQEPIMMTRRNRQILNDNCLRCHDAMVQHLASATGDRAKAVQCVHCHRSVGHGETIGLGRYDPKEGSQP